MRKLWKISLIMLVTVLSLLGFSLNAEAASGFKPYEYEFEKGESLADDVNKLNGYAPLKKMVITFDESIAENKVLKNNIFVREEGEEIELKIIDEPEIVGNVLTITFKNIDFIDYTTVKNLELVINKETLRNDQIEDYVLPFKIEDVLPGFESMLIDGDSKGLNEQIFMFNPPRDINVHVRQAYIETIETIHRNDGIYDDSVGPHLTNIDVFAHEDAHRLKASFNVGDDLGQFNRDMARHDSNPDRPNPVKGFTMGQAGIDSFCESEEIENELCDDFKGFELKAYSDTGRLLETRNFALRVINTETNFIYNDYLPTPDSVFGEPVKLYELMENPKLLTTIMSRIPVSELETALSISYPNFNNPNLEGRKIEEKDQLLLALDNEKIRTINLSDTAIALSEPINRSVTIKGGTLTGNVRLGDGTENLTIRLDEVTITGDLTINVGTEGTVYISDSDKISGDINIVSGGTNSIYLNKLPSNQKITMKNESPVRIVLGYSNNETNTNDVSMEFANTGEVTLEGLAGTLTLDAQVENAKLTVKNSYPNTIKLKEGTPEDLLILNVQGGMVLPKENVFKELNYIDSEKIDGKVVLEKFLPNKSDVYAEEVSAWGSTGKEIKGDLKDIASNVTSWEVTDAGDLDSNWNISFEGDSLKIKKKDDSTENINENVNGTIILTGETEDTIFNVKVSVEINPVSEI